MNSYNFIPKNLKNVLYSARTYCYSLVVKKVPKGGEIL